MDYETMVTITQTMALVFFVALFVGVIAFAFWPGNKGKFDRAARVPMETTEPADETGKS